MRDLFPWRFKLSESEIDILWKDATFVFDTSFLLNLYRISRSTAESFLNILDRINDQIWIPYQVIDEFTLRRDEIRHKELESFKKALIALETWEKEQSQFKKLRNCLQESGRLVFSELEYLFDEQDQYLSAISEVSEKFRSTIQNISEKHSFSSSEEDYISDKIIDLLDSSKVGRPFEDHVLEGLYRQADSRYEKKQPPGFEDSNKGDNRQYGDFLIWKEILEFAKLKSSPIIFVTGDQKDDWWTKKNGKISAPHIELRREFHEYTSQLFWMYTPTLFLEVARDRLAVEVDEKSLQESHEIAEIDFDENETSTSKYSHADVEEIPSNQIRLPSSSALGLRPFELPAKVTALTAPIIRGLSELDRLSRLGRIDSLVTPNIGQFSKYSQFNSILGSLNTDRYSQSTYGQIHQSTIMRIISDLDNVSKNTRRYM